MSVDDSDEVRAQAGDDLPTEEDSQRLFDAFAREHPGKRRNVPWGGPQDSLWKRLFAASVKASGIRVGRFPQ